ncbi:Lanosterol synthase (Oxidosqualene--lanosterol cyclase) [Nowakowskiella sp. JEL0407]|nr:Lanosterol synthase (Oxidosqualene--lanosterol cyclase) [Nowakowskiella sp. JEL0407]
MTFNPYHEIYNKYAPATDLIRWRMKVDEGRQTWHYLDEVEAKAHPQRPSDKYWLGILNATIYCSNLNILISDMVLFQQDCPALAPPKTPLSAARNGFEFYKQIQTEDGHWAGKYDGPMFLTPGIVIVMYVTKTKWKPGYVEEMIRYLKNHAHPEDGGWGLHTEGVSTCFGTALNYVALRLLGVPANDPVCVKARKFLHKLGGAVGAPHWGKFWLAILNCYDYKGMNPVPPEFWVLPTWLPISPSKWWIHTRNVYMPMSWLYANRFQAPVDDLILQLREEIFVTPYEKINWNKQRNNICKVDMYSPHTTLLETIFEILTYYEMMPISALRKYALDTVLDHIHAEDRSTKFAALGPINKVMNMLVIWITEGPESEGFKRHVDRNLDFMWMGEHGMNMNGTNGSQLWDCVFIVQALNEGGLVKEYPKEMIEALKFIDLTQMKDNPPDYKKYYRQPTKGAWPFSTRDQGYTISDCTGEGLKCVLMLQNNFDFIPKLVSYERMCDAVDIILGMQNKDGGFASYETIRSYSWLEWFNPAEVFGNIMIEYNYPECTTAAVMGLRAFKKYHPKYRAKEIDACVDRAVKWIKQAQREDGSWYGSWGICFTYCMMFALESLASIGEYYENSPSVQAACDFLIAKQRADGGWGETYQVRKKLSQILSQIKYLHFRRVKHTNG